MEYNNPSLYLIVILVSIERHKITLCNIKINRTNTTKQVLNGVLTHNCNVQLTEVYDYLGF